MISFSSRQSTSFVLLLCAIGEEPAFLRFTSIDGQDRSKPLPYDPSATIPEQVRTSFEKSLANLRTAYIDSYLLHSPLRTIQQTLEAWRVLIKLQDEGKIRMIGVSNTYDVGILRALGQERQVQVVQNRWYEGNAWDQDVVRYCKTHGAVYQCVPFNILRL